MLNLLPRPRAILFDWDNTLVDTWPCISRATNITLEAMGHTPWTPAEIRARVAGSLRDTFPVIYGERWEKAREIYYSSFADIHLEMLTVCDGAEEMLHEAAKAGIYLVVSNKTGKYLRAEANHLGWTSLFGRLVGAQDAARDKPSPDPVHLALSGSNIQAGRDVWLVGDAPIDVICGQSAGCSTVFVGIQPKDAFGDAAVPDRNVADCKALAGLVRASLRIS
jgi:phosphoglycolate phosphatase